jgi:GTP-binding protein
MSAAKSNKTRIRKPHEKDDSKKRLKPGDFSVARAPAASRRSAASAFGLQKAAYALSVHDPAELPAPGAPEIAFAGRSNAGKSSAINTLTGRRRLAFVSKTPGRTQLINFFTLGQAAFLVDLPGYGYADAPLAVRRHWEMLVGQYIAHRASLAVVVVVMDARHPLTALDRQLIGWLRGAGRATHVLLTKSDKLSKQAAQRTHSAVLKELTVICPGATAQLFSSLKNEGIEEATRILSRFALHKNKAPPKGE